MMAPQEHIMHSYIARLRARAFVCPQRIVLTDTLDDRVAAALYTLTQRSLIRPVLVGRSAELLPRLKTLGVTNEVDVYDPEQDSRQKDLIAVLRTRFEARGKAIPNKETLQAMAREPIYCGMLLVQSGMADGLVGGAAVPTAHVIRAGIQVVGVDPQHPVVSGAFAMLLTRRLPAGQEILIFSDAAVVPNPDARQLASIALNTAQTAKALLEEKPVIALLSFSTYGSAEDATVQKVRDALRLLRQDVLAVSDICIDGELQADAALIPEISARKAPGSIAQGRANVLIFPNLDASNIAYKLVERLSGATALGVILSGLTKPVNDLSRGCTADDMINMVALTALQASSQTYSHAKCEVSAKNL